MHAIIVLLLGIVGLGISGAFVGVGWAKNNQITTYLHAEKITWGLSTPDISKEKIVDNHSEAQNAALTLTAHRQSIAPAYNDLLGGQSLAPTNFIDLKNARAMNLQTNIYTAVLAFGLAESIMVAGAFIIAVGITFVLIGIVIYQLAKKSDC
jgi:hypothetical protein